MFSQTSLLNRIRHPAGERECFHAWIAGVISCVDEGGAILATSRTAPDPCGEASIMTICRESEEYDDAGKHREETAEEENA